MRPGLSERTSKNEESVSQNNSLRRVTATTAVIWQAHTAVFSKRYSAFKGKGGAYFHFRLDRRAEHEQCIGADFFSSPICGNQSDRALAAHTLTRTDTVYSHNVEAAVFWPEVFGRCWVRANRRRVFCICIQSRSTLL